MGLIPPILKTQAFRLNLGANTYFRLNISTLQKKFSFSTNITEHCKELVPRTPNCTNQKNKTFKGTQMTLNLPRMKVNFSQKKLSVREGVYRVSFFFSSARSSCLRWNVGGDNGRSKGKMWAVGGFSRWPTWLRYNMARILISPGVRHLASGWSRMVRSPSSLRGFLGR